MKIAVVSMEMLIPEFSEPFRGANFRGGLGILTGEIMEGLAKNNIEAVAIVPFYQFHWLTKEKIAYSNSSAKSVFKLQSRISEKDHNLEIFKIDRAGLPVFGLLCPEVFDTLYTLNRGRRYEQEILIGKIVSLLLKSINFKPDIIWLQEGHTVTAIPSIKDDGYFSGAKFLFTTHTSVPEGMEKYPGDWFDRMEIDRDKYAPIFLRNGTIDFTRAAVILADKVNAVSQEHAEIVRTMFPEFSQKIIGIRNGASQELWLSQNIKILGDNPNPLELWQAHLKDKKEFIELVEKKSGIRFDFQKPILGWVRRVARYKNQYPMLKPIIKAICAERGEMVETDFGHLEGLGMQAFFAGRASEDDFECLNWIADFRQIMQEQPIKGKFVFLDDYSYGLLNNSACGLDIWLSTPWPKYEACGTSDQRAAINGNINLVSRTGGPMEYITEGENGFFIEPYEPRVVYEKLKTISELYYAWFERGDERWLNLRKNSFESGKKSDIVRMIENYKKLLFEPMLLR